MHMDVYRGNITVHLVSQRSVRLVSLPSSAYLFSSLAFPLKETTHIMYTISKRGLLQ